LGFNANRHTYKIKIAEKVQVVEILVVRDDKTTANKSQMLESREERRVKWRQIAELKSTHLQYIMKTFDVWSF
jgi:hypothetical protein